MPQAVKDDQGWDFRAQHSWLVQRFWEDCGSSIEAAARKFSPPAELPGVPEPEPEMDHTDGPAPHAPIDDSDVPF
jgi:hypothetical protein